MSDFPDPTEIEYINESQECINLLREIDAYENVTVTAWEAEFLDTVFKQTFPLTPKQIVIADKIIDTYYKD